MAARQIKVRLLKALNTVRTESPEGNTEEDQSYLKGYKNALEDVLLLLDYVEPSRRFWYY